jgi:hypothetical protein
MAVWELILNDQTAESLMTQDRASDKNSQEKTPVSDRISRHCI